MTQAEPIETNELSERVRGIICAYGMDGSLDAADLYRKLTRSGPSESTEETAAQDADGCEIYVLQPDIEDLIVRPGGGEPSSSAMAGPSAATG